MEALERETTEGLIAGAFLLARESGKPDWRHMQAGVLKNRMLLLSDQQFDEARWGATSFTGFLERFPDIVSVDFEKKPPVVEYVGSDELMLQAARSPPQPSPPGHGVRWNIRSDLWSAILDYDKGVVHVWDDGAVRAIDEHEVSPEESRPTLPTVIAEDLQAWREEFARATDPSSPSDADALQVWLERTQSSWQLPPSLRHRWYAALKQHVRDRLEAWFQEKGIPPPEDFIEMRPTRRATERGAGDSTAQLRALVVRCVEAMSRSELEELRLPPAAVLRARH